MVQNAQRLGVPIEDILMEAEGRDTAEQAAQLQSFLKTQPFILCTSALFSPRAVLTFKLRGMNPIPSPSDFMESPDSIVSALQPSRYGWYLVNAALHEYVGLLWLEIREIGKKSDTPSPSKKLRLPAPSDCEEQVVITPPALLTRHLRRCCDCPV